MFYPGSQVSYFSGNWHAWKTNKARTNKENITDVHYFCGVWYYARINQSGVNFDLSSFYWFTFVSTISADLCGDRHSIPPPMQSCVYSTGVRYYFCPAKIPAACSLSKQYHQCIHLCTICCIFLSYIVTTSLVETPSCLPLTWYPSSSPAWLLPSYLHCNIIYASLICPS